MKQHTYSDGNPNLLGLNTNDFNNQLNAYNGNETNKWNVNNGFAFLLPKISSFLPRYFMGEF